jgi:hypothetical protein
VNALCRGPVQSRLGGVPGPTLSEIIEGRLIAGDSETDPTEDEPVRAIDVLEPYAAVCRLSADEGGAWFAGCTLAQRADDGSWSDTGSSGTHGDGMELPWRPSRRTLNGHTVVIFGSGGIDVGEGTSHSPPLDLRIRRSVRSPPPRQCRHRGEDHRGPLSCRGLRGARPGRERRGAARAQRIRRRCGAAGNREVGRRHSSYEISSVEQTDPSSAVGPLIAPSRALTGRSGARRLAARDGTIGAGAQHTDLPLPSGHRLGSTTPQRPSGKRTLRLLGRGCRRRAGAVRSGSRSPGTAPATARDEQCGSDACRQSRDR